MATSNEILTFERGVSLAVGGGALELSIPALFARNRMRFSPRAVAICTPDQLTEDTPSEVKEQMPPLQIAILAPRRRQGNLLLVLEEPVTVPPVRLRARLHARGMIFHTGRKTPVDGFMFRARDPGQATEVLVRHGVERTTTPAVWTWERRHRSRGPG
jgi:hypothetical protein